MRHPKILTSIIILLFVILTTTTLLVTRLASAATANNTVQTAWQLARLSGSYTFRSEVEQTTPIEPRMSSVGQHSTVNQYVISGTVDESNQQMLFVIENADNSAPPLEIRRDKRKTYTRQGEGEWRELTNVQQLNMTDTLAYLAGVEQITATQSGQSFDFAFNGNTFADAFRKSLQINASRGVTVNQEWSTIIDGEQLRGTNGSGSIQIDSDGLPKQMNLMLLIPQGEEKEAIQARIVTTYTEFARTGLALKQIYNSPLQLVASLMNGNAAQLLYGLWAGVFLLALIGALLVLLRFRVKLFAPLSLLIIAILVHSPFATVPAKASAAERASAAAATGQQPQLTAVSFDPRVAPEQQSIAGFLPPAGTVQAPADSSGASNSRSRTNRADTIVDSDGDGLNDDQEALIGSDRTKIDSDNDGLSDPQELQLGTSLTLADTDIDGITDYVEARIPSRNLDPTKSLTPTTYAAIQTQLYTNPLEDDTNFDGVGDGIECPQHMLLDNTSPESSVVDCSDSDRNGTPDFLTNDNDSDGIVDIADFDKNSALYGDASTKLGFSDANPFALRFDGLTPGKPLVVDVQIKPTNPRLLNANGAVYDWPSSDFEGQIQRTKDTTFAAPKDVAINEMSDANAGNGDVQVSAMLEVRVPVSATSFGALPVKSGARWSSATSGVPAWLDTTKTAPYSINAIWDSTGTNVVLTIPVRPITDDNGNVVSFAATTYFESLTSEWVRPATMRMVWLVSMIQDDCPPNNGNCTPSQRVQSFTPVQMYYSDYMIAGISAKEHLGYTAALITDDAVSSLQSNSNPYLFISQAKRLLTNSFVDDAYLFLKNDSQPTRALDQILSGTRNQTEPIRTTATRYGITPGTTNIQTVSYATDVASILVRNNVLTNVLNTNVCRTSASVTSCGTDANKTAILNACKTDTTSLRCNPGVIIADESQTRLATLVSYESTGATGVVSFNESEVITDRSVESSFYSIGDDGKWTANKESQLADVSMRIQQNIATSAATFSDITTETVEVLNSAAGESFVSTFLTSLAKTYYGTDLVTAQSVPTYAPNVIPRASNWTDYQSNLLTTYQAGIAKTIAIAKSGEKGLTVLQLSAQLAAHTSCNGMSSEVTTLLNKYGSETRTGDKDYVILSEQTIKDGNKPTMIVGKTAWAVYKVYDTYKAYKAFSEAKKVSKALTLFKSTMNARKAANVAKFASKLKPIATVGKLAKLKNFAKVNKAPILAAVGAVLEIGMAWAMAGMALASARQDYQKGNIIAGAIGQTIAIILLTVLSTAGPVGAIIAGIIGAIDAIAGAICEGLSERDRRSTAAQFLCGGISGLLAKMFTF